MYNHLSIVNQKIEKIFSVFCEKYFADCDFIRIFAN